MDMKRSIAVVLSLLSVLSCTREAVPVSTRSIEVGLESADSKTYLEGCKIFWSNGDRISANGQESEALASVPPGTQAVRFSFSQDVFYPLSILYPSSFYKDAQTITLPSLQNRAENTFATGAFPCAGILASEGENVVLGNLCALLKVQVTSSHEHPIKGVIFTGGSGEQVCGDFTLDYATRTLTPAGGSAQLKLATGQLSPGQTPAALYFVVPAGTYAGLSFRIIDTENHYMDVSKKSAVTLAAGTVYSFSTPVDFVPTKTLVDTDQGDFGTTGAVVRKIGSADQWNEFAASYNNGGFSDIDPSLFTVQLTADLDFKGKELVTIGSYSGGLEGRGFSIRNLTAYEPLFSSLTNASVTDLHIDASCSYYPDSQSDCGFIANTVAGTTSIAECSVAGTIAQTGGAESFGSLVGSISGEDCIIENCSSNATVTSDALFCGSLVGTLASGTLMRYCTNRGSVSGSGSVGGITGRLLDCDMDDCTNYGDIACTSKDGRLGGVMGLAHSSKCIITGGGNYGKLTGDCTKRGLLVGEFVKQVEFAFSVKHSDIRVLDSVEERGFHHGVVNHVFKYYLISNLEGLVK